MTHSDSSPENLSPHDSDDALPRSDDCAHELLEQSGNGLIIACDDAVGFTADERRRIAELQWLDVLLQDMHRPENASQDRRIQEVMSRIAELERTAPASGETAVGAESAGAPSTATLASSNSPAESPTRGGPRRWAATAVAIVVLFGAFIAFNNSQQAPTALASLDLAIAEASQAPSRTYQIDSLVRRPIGDLNLTSTLHVKGGRQFALRHPLTPVPGVAWLGSNGREVWFVPPVGPVIVSEKEEVLKKFIVDQKLSTPFLQITSVLSRLKERYELAALPNETLADSSDPSRQTPVRRLRGTIRESDTPWPRTIDLWLHPRTGMVRKMTLDWRDTSDALGPRFMTFLLIAEPDVGDDFYEHASHHAPGRPVIGR